MKYQINWAAIDTDGEAYDAKYINAIFHILAGIDPIIDQQHYDDLPDGAKIHWMPVTDDSEESA